MGPNIELTVVYPIIRDDYIWKSIRTLRNNTAVNLRVIVVDQTISGVLKGSIVSPMDLGIDMMIRMKNQGFSKAANEGIIHALQWKSEYICVANDDTEFIDPLWFQGIKEQFAADPRIVAVNPESPRVPLWGYGRDHNEYADIVEYKEEFTKADMDYLKAGNYQGMLARYPDLPKTFPLEKRGVVDAFAMWCPVFKADTFDKVGLFDERFIWGGGEDYDWMARAYSCAWPYDRTECNENFHWRAVSTMKSWVWHWWGKSKDVKGELDPRLFEGKKPWNNLSEIWEPAPTGQSVDPWGHWTDNKGVKRPFRRDPEVRIEPL